MGDSRLTRRRLFVYTLLVRILQNVLRKAKPPTTLFFSAIQPRYDTTRHATRGYGTCHGAGYYDRYRVRHLLGPGQRRHEPFHLLSPTTILVRSMRELLLLHRD